MAYSGVEIIAYLYSVFSPYKVADYISKSLPDQLGYIQLGLLFALAVALMVGRRRMLNLLLLAFGGFEGYVAATALTAAVALSRELTLIVILVLAVAGALVVYKISRVAICAFIALTAGAMLLTLGIYTGAAPFISIAVFVVAYIFYKYIASVIAALIGSILLLLFLIQLDIPGATPYVLSAAAFALSVTVRHMVSRIGGEKGKVDRHAAANRANN